ncbi:MAG: thiamine phosphate synthase, partial [Desulfobacterales bacterium]|nr:thiamine phosphate synthase [Desulfobacterales bacterium]
PLAQVRKIVGEEMIVGISTHTLDEAVGAQEGGADYIGFGPVYETSTKKEAGNPRGAEVVTHIRENVDIPVVAIGGIDCDCLNELFSNGAKAVAVASAILRG